MMSSDYLFGDFCFIGTTSEIKIGEMGKGIVGYTCSRVTIPSFCQDVTIDANDVTILNTIKKENINTSGVYWSDGNTLHYLGE